ncbi:MAG: hypothetical protein ACYC9L_02605 [Sulfuricaulis sp.]
MVIRNSFAIRSWQHVLEPLRGYLMLAKQLWYDGARYAEGWNFSPNDDDAKRVEWIVNKITGQWGDGPTWNLDNREYPHEANYLKLDISKAKLCLG